ncbi:aspartyl-phosphate phosphatase Spo0E family protein [Halalkalibacter urbisdiaboli]|uniref:aspartyl-phosphate phosphatase Spo0E family protein n=1 Tax=Halalkalibacter urbisdiaboli TaxID=1960589 RepID=UPI000B4424FF|nr:aspartyl-phosphate phosphatase Spo0E family protein [Halalkalibacter urbisdiaboli]
MNNMVKYEACMEKIENLRNKMTNAARQHGMAHPQVLKYSQELDRAHNLILSLELSEKNSWSQQIAY